MFTNVVQHAPFITTTTTIILVITFMQGIYNYSSSSPSSLLRLLEVQYWIFEARVSV